LPIPKISLESDFSLLGNPKSLNHHCVLGSGLRDQNQTSAMVGDKVTVLIKASDVLIGK
jgi:hypothetical protein